MPSGHCHCGAIRYEVTGDPVYQAVCHCEDCRRHAGAPMVGWSAYPAGAVSIVQGEPKTYASSENGRRQFCADCGTSLFYTNEVALPGLKDVQSCTLDDPEAAAPQVQVQCAERLGWMERLETVPKFDRYPTPE